MFRITKQKSVMGWMGFLFFYSYYSYGVEPTKTIQIGVIDEGGGLDKTLPLILRTNKVEELLISANHVSPMSYAPDGAQVLSIIGGKADGQFPGGYAPKSELFYYGGGNLFYANRQYQSIYHEFYKKNVRLLYHGVPSYFNKSTEAEKSATSLLLDIMNHNKTLIIWPAIESHDLSTSCNAEFILNQSPEFQKGALIVSGYNDFTKTLDSGSASCGEAYNVCLMADYTVPVPSVPGAVDNIQNNSASGTKFSAAIVTGVAALVLQKFPWMGNDLLRQTLLSTAKRTGLYLPQDLTLPPIPDTQVI